MLTLSSLSAFTPAPPHAPWQRRRLERVRKRMDRLKKQSWMCTGDDDDEKEADELDDTKASKEKEEETEELFVKPVLKPGEVWDPFGDEYEV